MELPARPDEHETVAAAVHLPDDLDHALAVPVDPTAAAFFDLDNTLLRGASVFHLAKGLYRRKFFGARDIAAMLWKQAWFLAVGENLDHVAKIREQGLGYVAGHSVTELTEIGEEIYDRSWARRSGPARTPWRRCTSTPGS